MEKYYLNSELEIGVDEAGRGPLIGRVYAGAVIYGKETEINLIINDSKKLSPKKRKIALEWIKNNVKAWGVGWAEADEIDNKNILQATQIAMDRAIQNLITNFNLNNEPITLIIDGLGWDNKFINYTTNSIVKGDTKYLSIAAASIIAKEHHDEYIKQLCLDNPGLDDKYGLLKNMGYGTKKHFIGIEKHGITEFHRKTFKPCCNFLYEKIEFL